MINWIRKAFYLYVIAGFSISFAGSYEDFFIAVQRDNRGAVASLLQRGFDPNTRDPKGQVALFLALQSGNLGVAEALFASPDLQVNMLNSVGESALMMTALKGDLGWCQRLLDRGAQVNQPGWSPLHYAASGPEVKTVRLLLDRGARIDAESPNRSTPLMMAARYGSEESVALLLERGANVKLTNDLNQSAADFARLGGRESLAARLESKQR